MRLLDDLFICLRFFSRLPVPETERECAFGAGGLAAASAMAPVAGALIGGLSALVLLGARAVGLPPFVAATLALTASIVVTGGLHEDALADCADGFGGGRTRERKLEIMRDSRIGAFGACAIGLSLMLRGGTLAALAPIEAVYALIGAAALSRGACLLPLAFLPPARPAGMGASVALSERRAGIVLGVAVLVVAGASLGHPVAALIALGLGLASAVGVSRFARAQIGGQTGDVAGAVQQIVEIVVLLVFAA